MFTHDFHFGYNFIPENEACPARLTSTGVETDWDKDMIHDNSKRPLYSYIFLYTISGSGTVEWTDGSTHILDTGKSALLFMPESSKYYTTKGSDELWHYYYIMFIVDKMVKPMCNEIQERHGYCLSLPPNCLTYQSAVDLITKRRNGLICHAKLADAAVYDLICKLYYDVTTQHTEYSILVQRCILIMEERYGKMNGIQELSTILGLSAEHITRAFTKEVKMSPINYLTKLRLSNALPLLSNTSMPIQDVGKACGFQSGSYFCNVFKNKMSISPSEYRRKNRFKHD